MNASDTFYPPTDGDKSTGSTETTEVAETKVEPSKEDVELAEASTPETTEVPDPENTADKEPVETEDPESKESKKETLKSYYENNEDNSRSLKNNEFSLKEGDFEEKDGQLIIRAKHLADDVDKYFKLGGDKAYNHIKRIRRANPEKAELMAKYMGFTLPSGEADVDKFMSVSRRFFSPDTPEDEANSILQEEYPEWVTSGEGNPFVFEEPEKPATVSPDIPYSIVDVEDSIKSLVEVYNSKQGGEGNHISEEQVMNDPKVLKFVKNNKYDPATGKIRNVKELVKMSFDQFYKIEKPKVKAEGGKRTVVPTKVSTGNKKRTGMVSSYNKTGKASEIFYS